MTGLPRSIIKKYGVSKKAWSVFRGERGTRTTKRRVTSMARFRKQGEDTGEDLEVWAA